MAALESLPSYSAEIAAGQTYVKLKSLPPYPSKARCLQMSDEERRSNARERPVHLTLVSFAVTRRAYETITERFAEQYEAATGVPVKFRLSFGGSGTQVRALLRPRFAISKVDQETAVPLETSENYCCFCPVARVRLVA